MTIMDEQEDGYLRDLEKEMDSTGFKYNWRRIETAAQDGAR